MKSYQHLYTRFIKQNPGVQHLAAHSHHYWPDVTRDAMLEYWDDSSKYVDSKWDYFFENKVRTAQQLIAQTLNVANPEQITFAPSTHELAYRILSCLMPNRPRQILTTDSEFHSWDRQLRRTAENPQIQVTRIAVQPFETFQQRWEAAAASKEWDLVFFSHVFYNGGWVVPDLNAAVRAVTHPKAIVVVDGYHGFMAVPTDLSAIQSRVFYLAGSYKYAQGGEGCCFLISPLNTELRPEYTGWWAELGHLETKTTQITYPKDQGRFAGSTMDLSPLYRLVATLQLLAKCQITVPVIHQHVQEVQKRFLAAIEPLQHPLINKKTLLAKDLNYHGHFFAFDCGSEAESKRLCQFLKSKQIITDAREGRLRFGFGLYHDGSFDLSVLKGT